MRGGPTQVDARGHRQMNNVSPPCSTRWDNRTATATSAVGTLLMLMRQHNVKEENILYPMRIRAGGQQDALHGGRMAERVGANSFAQSPHETGSADRCRC